MAVCGVNFPLLCVPSVSGLASTEPMDRRTSREEAGRAGVGCAVARGVDRRRLKEPGKEKGEKEHGRRCTFLGVLLTLSIVAFFFLFRFGS
jgi:hypothetical protein